MNIFLVNLILQITRELCSPQLRVESTDKQTIFSDEIDVGPDEHMPLPENNADIPDATATERPSSFSKEVNLQTSFPCSECEKKKEKIESLQKVRSKQRERLRTRLIRIRELEKENKDLKKVGFIR